jgi:hypothetical protein
MMTNLIINDLSESKTLDMEALRSVRGGHSYYGGNPVNIEEILGWLPGLTTEISNAAYPI